MSTYQQLIKSLVCSALFIMCMSLISCGGKNTMEPEIGAAQVKPEAVSTKANDKQFLVRAIEMKYEQVLIAKLVQTRSFSDEIKMFARILEDYNREAKSTLASLAIMESITVPSAPTQSAHDLYSRLNEATVEDFEYSYLNLVIQKHQDAISLFERATIGNIDPDIRAKATAMLPQLRNHLSQAMEMNGRLTPGPVAEVAP